MVAMWNRLNSQKCPRHGRNHSLSQNVCEETICPFTSVGVQVSIQGFFGNGLETKTDSYH